MYLCLFLLSSKMYWVREALQSWLCVNVSVLDDAGEMSMGWTETMRPVISRDNKILEIRSERKTPQLWNRLNQMYCRGPCTAKLHRSLEVGRQPAGGYSGGLAKEVDKNVTRRTGSYSVTTRYEHLFII